MLLSDSRLPLRSRSRLLDDVIGGPWCAAADGRVADVVDTGTTW